MSRAPRVQCFVDDDQQVIILRVIGDVPPDIFVDLVFEKLSGVREPWTYARLFDVRRWDHRFGADTVKSLARRWAALTEGHIYHARVAVTTFDHGTHFREAAASEHFPDETVCYFDNYHEAMGWLKATDPAAYIRGLADKPPNNQTYGGIVIE